MPYIAPIYATSLHGLGYRGPRPGGQPVTIQSARGTELSGILEDFIKIVQPIANDTTKQGQQIINTETNKLVSEIVKSTPFKKVLNEVENSARQAVTEEAKKNAFLLMTLAVAGGAVGGTVFRGTIGTVAAGAIAAWSAYKLIGGGVK